MSFSLRLVDNARMRPKITGPFLLATAMFIVMGLMAIDKIHTLDRVDKVVFEGLTGPLATLGSMKEHLHQLRADLRDLLLARTAQEAAGYTRQAEQQARQLDALAGRFQKTLSSPGAKARFDALQTALAAWSQVHRRVAALAASGKPAEALSLLRAEGVGPAAQVQRELDDLAASALGDAKVLEAANSATAAGATQFLAIMMAAALVLSVGLGWLLARSITVPLAQGVQMMQEMAKGHLGTRLKLTRTDEIGELACAMDGFTDSLQFIVTGLHQVAKGDLSREWVSVDGRDEIAPALKQVRASLTRPWWRRPGMLLEAAKAGKLATRAPGGSGSRASTPTSWRATTRRSTPSSGPSTRWSA